MPERRNSKRPARRAAFLGLGRQYHHTTAGIDIESITRVSWWARLLAGPPRSAVAPR